MGPARTASSALGTLSAEVSQLDRLLTRRLPTASMGIDYRVTIEALLYAAIAFVGAVLRLWALGTRPLQPEESAIALEAWHIVAGEPANLAAGPALIYPTAIIFFLFGASDTAARLVPALAGSLLVASPYLFRRQTGPLAALCAAMLLALSPSLVFFSRYVGTQTLILMIALASMWAMMRYLQEEKLSYLYLAGASAFSGGASAGLLAVSGPSAYNLLLIYGLVALGALAVSRLRGWGKATPFVTLPAAIKPAGLAALAVLVLVSTGGLTNVQGLQSGFVSPLSDWLRFAPESSIAQPARYFSAALLAYELPTLLLAILAVSFPPPSSRYPLAILLTSWALVALAILSLGLGRGIGDMTFLVVPLAFLAGIGLEQTVTRVAAAANLKVFLSFAVAVTPALALMGVVWSSYTLLGDQLAPTLRTFSIGPLSNMAATMPVATINAILLAFPIIFFAVTVTLTAIWLRPGLAAYSLLGVIILLLIGFNFHTAWNLNLRPAISPTDLLLRQVTSFDIGTLVTEIERHSAVLSTPGKRDLTVALESKYKYPLAWYLREYTKVSFFDGTPKEARVIITNEKARPPAKDYAGAKYTLTYQPVDRGPANLRELWRRLFYREGGETQNTDIMLYISTKIQ